MTRQVLAVIVGAIVAASCDGAGNGSSSTEGSRARLEDALIARADVPSGWSRFEPRQESSGGFDVCGINAPTTPEPTGEAAVAWAQDPVEGPILGERIEVYSKGGAAETLQIYRGRPLPCEWTQYGMRWRATAEPSIDLGDDSWVFLIEGLAGRGSYNYEVLRRRDDVLVLFVLNVHEPDRELLEELVSR